MFKTKDVLIDLVDTLKDLVYEIEVHTQASTSTTLERLDTIREAILDSTE